MTETQAPKILVIEDETTQRILMKEYLEESGYVVRLADDGNRGLKMATLIQPDVIILDMLLPSLDGHTLCQHLKQDPATENIPVILVTASREADIIERGMAAGASDFITKPVDWSYMADRVAHVLQQSEDRAELIAAKQASEEALQTLLESSKQLPQQAGSQDGLPQNAATETSAPATEKFDEQLQEVRAEAEKQVREIEQAAQEVIDAERMAYKVELESAAQKMTNMTRSFWSVISAASESHIAMLASLDRLTRGLPEEAPATEVDEFPIPMQEENAVQSLLSSTRYLKHLAQYMTGNANLNSGPVDLVKLISETLDQAKPKFEQNRLNLVVDIPQQPVSAMIDENQVRYVLASMITNALEFSTPTGTIHVSLTADSNRPVELKIGDTGIGMAPTLIENLRAAYEDPASAIVDKSGRLGLGIPLSTAIVKAHGGSLEIDSTIGTGTTITVCIPEDRKCQRDNSQNGATGSRGRTKQRKKVDAADRNPATANV